MRHLYDLQTPAPLRVVLTDGTAADAILHHFDGMYSYCYLVSDESKVFHLSMGTPLKKVKGRWEIAED